jgi:hypothetical protein
MQILAVFWSLWLLALVIVYVAEERAGRRRWAHAVARVDIVAVDAAAPYRTTAVEVPWGLGLVSIPGLIAAVKLYRAGLALLRRDTTHALRRVENAVA